MKTTIGEELIERQANYFKDSLIMNVTQICHLMMKENKCVHELKTTNELTKIPKEEFKDDKIEIHYMDLVRLCLTSDCLEDIEKQLLQIQFDSDKSEQFNEGFLNGINVALNALKTSH